MKAFFGVLFLIICFSSIGQVVLYNSNFGTTSTSGGTLVDGWIASGANPNNFSISTASASSGYNSPFSASGSANLSEGVTGTGTGTSYITLSGQVNTLNVTSIQVSFAYRASSASYPGSVSLEWSSDGITWTNISLGTLTYDGAWKTVNGGSWISLPAGAENINDLQFRFSFTRTGATTQNFRIDDFHVRGMVPFGSAPTDYFRSRTTGFWNSSVSWESSSDNSNWINATLIPSSSANTITILTGHTITINSNVSADQLTIEPGATLNHTNTATFTLNDHASGTDMIVNGTYVLNGIKPVGSGTFVINSGAVVRAAANSGGESDDFAFSTNSNVLFKTGSVFEWATSSIFGASGVTYFSSSTEFPTFRIAANVGNVGGGSATVINGLFEVASGGSITWDDAGEKTFRDGIVCTGTINQTAVSGIFSIGGGGIQTVLGGGGTINLNTAGMQIASGRNVLLNGNITINNSVFTNYGTFNCQSFVINGSGSFTNAANALLMIGSAQGIAASESSGNIQTTGRNFNTNATYIYNGATSQITGTGLPSSVSVLSISSAGAAGDNTVTLTNNNTTVTTNFNLNSGFFAAGAGNNLQIASGGTIYGTGGHNPNDPSAGNIVFLGNGSTIGILPGHPYLYSVVINGGVDFNGAVGQSATVLNKLQLNNGAYVTDAPYYQSGSSLVYSMGGTYSRSVEWGSESGQGYPHHVIVQGGTILDLNTWPNLVPASISELAIAGDLIIGNAAGWGRVYMNNSMNKPLSIGGNLVIASTDAASASSVLELSSAYGGDLWLQGNFTRYTNGSYNDNDRAIFFIGTTNASVNTPDAVIAGGNPTQNFNYAVIAKSSGSSMLTLNCPVGILKAMTFTTGVVISSAAQKLVFNDNSTTTGASDFSFVNGPVKKIGDDIFIFPVGKQVMENPSVGGYRAIGITPVSNTSSTDAFTAEFMQSSATALGPITAPLITRVSRCEYWKLDKNSGDNNLAVNVTAFWTNRSNCNVVATVPYISDLPKLALAHFDGASWNSAGGAGNVGAGSTTTNGNITWENVTEFSPFSLASTDFLENLLPLNVSNFDAKPHTENVLLNWTVTQNEYYSQFTIERSRDGVKFEKLKAIPAKTNSFSASYIEVDDAPNAGWNYYRLKATGETGDERYSHIVRLWFGRQQQVRISPNPASEKIMVSLAEPSSISQIELVNISGQVLQGTQTIRFINIFEISHLQAGIYYLRISGKNGLSTTSFIKQ